MPLTAEQQAIRMAGPGGSEIGAVLGVSRFSSPLQVYLRLTGQLAEQEATEDMDRGTYLEPGLRDWYAKKTGRQVAVVGTMRGPKPFMVVSPDGLVLRPDVETLTVPGEVDGFKARVLDPKVFPERCERGLEIKAPGPHQGVDWGEPGSDEVPAEHFLQVAWGMACLGLDRWDVAALLQGRLEIYTVHRDPDLEAMVEDRVAAFMRDYVEPRRPPPATWCARDAEWLAAKYPKHMKPMVEEAAAPEEIRTLIPKLREAYQNLKGWERTYEGRAAQLKGWLGEAEGLLLADGRKVTWKAPERGPVKYKDAYAAALSLAKALINGAITKDVAAKEWERLFAADGFRGTPGRRFTVPRAWGGISEGDDAGKETQ